MDIKFQSAVAHELFSDENFKVGKSPDGRVSKRCRA